MLDDFLYGTEKLRYLFGTSFVGPAVRPHATETLVAMRTKDEGSDGFDVEVYASAWPALFLIIKALPTANSCGELRPGFTLSTGSGMSEWAAEAVSLICSGMLSGS